ncbi:MAG TPA: NAD(P)-dependent oxidoreductase, partial [Feifaniaceae bacterium]|nr:NAD(P)-dependent oxidoreductase [Feifaniaceae bacterium]
MSAIAFIGTGIMGAAMAGHLLDAGHTLFVYNRTREKAQPILNKGASWRDTPAACVQEAEFAITMVGYPHDVEETYFGEEGLLNAAKPGTVLIDMTTSSPKLAKRIYEEAKRRGLSALDAPVSGGDVGAKNAALSIMVGGDEDAYGRALPLFDCMGKTVSRIGGAGAGQHTKMANQIAVAGAVAGVSEAIAYAKAAGLDA